MEEPAGVRCRVEQVVDLAGDEAFQASGGFSPGVSLSDLLLQIRLGAVVAAFPGGGDDVQSPVGLPIPARLSRCRWVLPEEAGSGATPHNIAKAGSLCTRSGLSPAVSRNWPAVSVPIPVTAISCGARSVTKPSSKVSESLISSASCR